MKTLNAQSKILLFLLFFTNNNTVSAQFFQIPAKTLDNAGLMITYELKFKEDSTNLSLQRREEMVLLVGDRVSIFTGKNFYAFRQQGKKAEREGRLDAFLDEFKASNRVGRFTYSIYKNYPVGKITYTNKVLPGFFLYEEDFETFRWELKDTKEKFGDYNTRLAAINYGGRLWTAWYTTEVPLSEGPYKFRGLPGLIVKMADSKGHYIFEIVSIERLSEITPIELEEHDYVRTSRERYLRSEENLRMDIISRAREAGANSQAQQTAARNMQRRNNPIELK